ncbi:MAG: TetR/AcrR family transcriptional regulator [Ilumatobacteraceae bacterium]|nr:TetR/AcrR family transcriptional regulator [Ilumatobacteraceae bacterium]
MNASSLLNQSTDTTQPHCDPRVERTRAAVLEAASEQMMISGPSAITHASVAAIANVSRTTVYKHWPTRADLLRATLEALGKTSPGADELTGELRPDLGILFGTIVMDLADDQRAPLIATMMERALHDSTVTAVRDELMADFEPVFQTIISTAAHNGELRNDIDPELALASILGSFIYMRFLRPTTFDVATGERILDEFIARNAAP